MFGLKYDENMIPAYQIRDYLETIKASWMYEFLKTGILAYETELIFFSHAPQRNPKEMTPTSLVWGHRHDHIDNQDGKVFKVPNGRRMAVHGHMNMARKGKTFPRIMTFEHSGTVKNVVMADCGCGSSSFGELHPVIIRETTVKDGNHANNVDVIAIL